MVEMYVPYLVTSIMTGADLDRLTMIKVRRRAECRLGLPKRALRGYQDQINKLITNFIRYGSVHGKGDAKKKKKRVHFHADVAGGDVEDSAVIKEVDATAAHSPYAHEQHDQEPPEEQNSYVTAGTQSSTQSPTTTGTTGAADSNNQQHTAIDASKL